MLVERLALYTSKKECEKTELQFKTVLISVPSGYICRYNFGLSFFFQNQPEKALSEFQRAQELNKPNTALLMALLETCMKLNPMAEASCTLQTLDQQLSGDDTSHLRLAEYLVSPKAYELPVKELERLVKNHSDSLDLKFDLALAGHRAGKEIDVVALLRKLVPRQDTAELEDLLGEVEEIKGKSETTIEAFRCATELDRESIDNKYD
jgi:tetratricopeptide (TPR) repeat protein